jgi:hypothetical protein
MQTHYVSFESHQSGATIYIAGLLSDPAAIQTEEILRALSWNVFAVRLDLRAVAYIDPDSFVRVACAVRRWRDARAGHVTLEFPERSQPRQVGRHIAADRLTRRMNGTAHLVLEC